jgi:hypothetical protein
LESDLQAWRVMAVAPMDAFDQLAWLAAKDVVAFEKKMPGMQDPEVLRAAIRVLRIFSDEEAADLAAEDKNPRRAPAKV